MAELSRLTFSILHARRTDSTLQLGETDLCKLVEQENITNFIYVMSFVFQYSLHSVSYSLFSKIRNMVLDFVRFRIRSH